MTTSQDQQSREAYEDGKWYWVEREGWHGEPPTIAPACYKAECDAWYSYIFSGISTPYLKVLEPCELQAARALPAGMEPDYWLASYVTNDGKRYDVTLRDEVEARNIMLAGQSPEPLYTAAQVQAMGRVPLTDDQVDAALIAWFGHDQCLEAGYQYRMRRAINAAHGITHPTGD